MKKIAIRIGAFALVICCLAGIFTFSATADAVLPTASIKGHNIALRDNVYIMYYVEFQNVPAGAEKGVLVWTHPQEEYVYGTQTAILPYDGVQNDYDVYYFTGVSAKMMSQDIYAKAYVKVDDEITYGKLDKYSVLQYAYNKKGSTTALEGSTKTLGELLTSLLEYGTIAQEFFNYNTDRLANATYYQITVEGGTLPDGTTKGLYPAGTQVELTATIENFDHWENHLGGYSVEAVSPSIFTVEQNETYTAISEPILYSDGISFVSNGDGTCYVSGIGTCTDTDLKIPPLSPDGDAVTKIKSFAFNQCSALTSITIPNSVTSIENDAFVSCTSLTSIIIPNSVRSIGNEAFTRCSSLTSITLPNHLWSIGDYMFYNCTALVCIEIPRSVTSITGIPFGNCTALTSITYSGTKAQWNAISKGKYWNTNTGSYTIHCTDGDIAK